MLHTSDATGGDSEESFEAMEAFIREPQEQHGFVAPVKGGDEKGREKGQTEGQDDSIRNLDTTLSEQIKDV